MTFFSRFAHLLITALIVLHGPVITGKPATVSNREAAPDVVGYLPASDTPSSVNPPVIGWLDEPGATSWTLQVARDATFVDKVFTVRDWPWLIYTHTEPLAPGTYFWRYRYATASGEGSDWSLSRKFMVDNKATRFPRPSPQYLQSTLSGGHPRMFMMPEKLAELRTSATRDNAAFVSLIKSADNALTAPIMAEPKPWTGGKWNAAEWGEYLRQASAATSRMDNLAFAWLLTGRKDYGEQAKQHLMEYVRWDPHGPSSMRINDEVGMPMLHSISRAYDWLFPLLSSEDKEQILKHMRERGEETYNYMRRKPYEQYVHNSHFGRMFHFLGEAGVAFYREIPEAEKWLNYALTIFYGWYPYWGGEDGGWAEGIWYWSSYNTRVTWWLDLMRESMGVDGSRKPFYAKVADFPMFVAPPGNPVAGFGDFSEKPAPPASVGSAVGTYALMRHHSLWQWYADQTSASAGSGPFAYLRSLKSKPDPVVPENLPLLKLFDRTGYALFHSNLASARENVHVAMRCSPYGNVSHSHNDQNAIVMAAFGEPLLVNTGIRDYYGSPFCKEYYWATQSHNSILFDGQGQKRDLHTKGHFLAHGEEQSEMAWVVGEATNAYPDFVTHYRRWLIFLPQSGAVMIDEVKTTGSTASLLFHGRAPFEWDEHSNTFGLKKGKVELEGKIAVWPSNDPVTFTQTDQYPVPLGNNRQPLFDEWHLRANIPLTKNADETQYFVTWLNVTRGKENSNLTTWSYSWSEDKVVMSQNRRDNRLPIKLEVDFKNPGVRLIK